MRQFLGQDAWICEAQQAADALSQPEKLSVNDVGVIRWRKLAAHARQSGAERGAGVSTQSIYPCDDGEVGKLAGPAGSWSGD